MTNYEHLNVVARVALERLLKDVDTSVFRPDDLEDLLIANFLREISDTLARIDEKLGGLEMNERSGG